MKLGDFLNSTGKGEQNYEDKRLLKCLNYKGSKSTVVHKIIELLPPHKHYVEVFGGSGAVLLNKHPVDLEVFNDAYSAVADFYKAVFWFPDELIARCSLLVQSRELFEEMKQRAKGTDLMDRAVAFYYLVQCSFSGNVRGFARSKKGENTIPLKLRTGMEMFTDIHLRLRNHNVIIENRDWRVLVEEYDDVNTLFYMDPPYHDTDDYGFRWKWKDTEDVIQRAFNMHGAVALSAYNDPRIDSFAWDEQHVIEMGNQFATTIRENGSNTRKEKLYIKYSL